MENRLLTSAKYIEERLNTIVSEEKRNTLKKTTEITPMEIVAYQELKTLAQMKGLITLEEANTIYRALLIWDVIDLPLKLSITVGIGELAKLRAKGSL